MDGELTNNGARAMRTDFENLQDGQRIRLIPNQSNPLYKKPVLATFSGGYFYCDGSDPLAGPDYYFGDVLAYNEGFEVINGGV